MSKGPGGALGMIPVFGGMEVIYAPFMDAGAYYLSDYGSATPTNTTEYAGQGKGPRYVILNLEHFTTIFHVDKYFQASDIRHPEQQPTSNVKWYDTYFNFKNSGRWLSGIVAPGTTSGVWPARTYTAQDIYSNA